MDIPADGGVTTIDDYARLQVEIPRALQTGADYDAVMTKYGLDRHRWSAAQAYWGGLMNADETLVMQFAEAKLRYMKKRR